MSETPKLASDAELIALAALENQEAVLMAGENQFRNQCGHSPEFMHGSGFMAAGNALQEELYKRGFKV